MKVILKVIKKNRLMKVILKVIKRMKEVKLKLTLKLLK